MNRFLVYTLGILAMWASAAVAVRQVTHSLDDIELLGKQGKWGEVISYLNEVPSMDRSSRWQAYLEEAALQYLKEVAQQDKQQVETAASTLRLQFPSLERSSAFQGARDEYMLEGFAVCFRTKTSIKTQKTSCANSLVAFVNRNPTDETLLLSAVELLQSNSAFKEALEILIPALQEPDGSRLCTSPLVRRSIAATPEAKRCP